MNAHEQFADDLALYALKALEGEDRKALEQHLESCSACRRELEQLRGDMALLALSTAGPAPPQRARQRLMSAIRQEPRAREVEVKARPSWWGQPGWITAAAMLVMLVLMGMQNSRRGQELVSALTTIHNLENDLAAQQAELQQARAMVSTLTAADAQLIQVSEPNTPPRPQGKAFYVKERSSLLFIASNMPALPAKKAYELWLIPANGSAPIPAGVFKPDARGNATVVNPPLPPQVEAKAFAITIENEGGAATPTMPIKMVGAGS